MTKPRATQPCRFCGTIFTKSFTKQLICMPACAFWARVVKTERCWQWTGAKHVAGYGEFRFAGETLRAHRFSYELHHGPVRDGMHVAHHCDNPPCTNPEHVFLATHDENMLDMAKKLRTGQAKLDPEEVRHVRARLAAGETQTGIARDLDMSQSAIWLIKEGWNWSHVK